MQTQEKMLVVSYSLEIISTSRLQYFWCHPKNKRHGNTGKRLIMINTLFPNLWILKKERKRQSSYHTNTEFRRRYFLTAVYHLCQTCKLRHQSQQALLPHCCQVVYSQPGTEKGYMDRNWNHLARIRGAMPCPSITFKALYSLFILSHNYIGKSLNT